MAIKLYQFKDETDTFYLFSEKPLTPDVADELECHPDDKLALRNAITTLIENGNVKEIRNLYHVPTEDLNVYPFLTRYLQNIDMDSSIKAFFDGNAVYHNRR